MSFIWAMIFGGVICGAVQLLTDLKVPFPLTAILMILAGGILTPAGVMNWVLAAGAGGPNVTAVGCGNGAYSAGAAASAGILAPLVISVILNVTLIAMGAACGLIMSKKGK